MHTRCASTPPLPRSLPVDCRVALLPPFSHSWVVAGDNEVGE